jgi:hypothetical protein
MKMYNVQHTREKSYKCDVSGKRISQMGSLMVHKRICTGQKLYKYDVCGKIFAKKYNKIHTKPLQIGQEHVSRTGLPKSDRSLGRGQTKIGHPGLGLDAMRPHGIPPDFAMERLYDARQIAKEMRNYKLTILGPCETDGQVQDRQN